MTPCLPDLLAILGNVEEPEDLKTYVLATLRDMGTPESHRQAWDILRVIPALTNQLRALACETLYPGTIGPVDIAMLLEKPSLREETPGSLQHAIERLLEERLTPEHAGLLIVELNRLLQLAPHISMSNKETRISVRFEFLLEILPLALTKLLSSASLTEAECALAHPCVRRCFFWQSVGCWRADHASDENCFLVMHEFRQVLHPAASDLDWMIADVETSSDRADRRLALHIVLRLMERHDRRMARLRRAVSVDPELSAVLQAARFYARWAWFAPVALSLERCRPVEALVVHESPGYRPEMERMSGSMVAFSQSWASSLRQSYRGAGWPMP
jgi:hypothetical protein